MIHTERDQAAIRLQMLRLIASDGGQIELRCLRDGRPQQEWCDPRRASRLAGELAATHEVYAGMLPRFERSGGKSALRYGRVLWADCDTPGAVAALNAFRPRPTFVVRSGSVTGSVANLHAWWVLKEICDRAAIERGNRRIAHCLRSDQRVCDAARILRLPGTLNHKTTPPTAVVCIYDGKETTLRAVVRNLRDPPSERPHRAVRAVDPDDDLRGIPAESYIPALCGRPIGRDGKLRCPLHANGQERTASLHVYREDRGWYCFGCATGGDVFTFAAALWRMDVKREFPAVRDRLHRELLRRAA